jgi:ribosomal protein L34E
MPDKKDKPCPGGKCKMHFVRRIDDSTNKYRCGACTRRVIVIMSGSAPEEARTKEVKE